LLWQSVAVAEQKRERGSLKGNQPAETPKLVEATNSTVGQLISFDTMDRVPLLTRDEYELVQLSAGVNATNGRPNAADTPAIFNDRRGADVSPIRSTAL
jgi:hypothetical protein